jgi:2-keto-3-deoxy-L-rhamnonate aldolase RhmA
MEPPINPLRARLQRGELAVGLGVRLARVSETAPLAARCGFDWLFLDLEHSPMSLETAAAISVAALGAGVAPLARVSARDYTCGARMLDAGAWGVLMSHVDTAADAAEMVAELRFPPAGRRSVSYAMVQLGFPPLSGKDAAAQFERDAIMVAMIESVDGVANADAIAAVPGVDALFVGANDLSMDLGVAGDFGHDKIAEACDRVIEACRRHGKWPALGGVYAQPLLRRYVSAGMRMVLGGTDMALLTESAGQRATMIRGLTSSAEPRAAG